MSEIYSDLPMNTRTHILNTAESLFNERGYTAVGIDLIRDTAQVSKTTMYRQFQSKQGLIYAVLERRDERFRESIQKAVNESPEGIDSVRVIFEWHYQWFGKRDFKGCMFMHALAEFKTSDQDTVQLAKKHKNWLRQLFRDHLPPSEGNKSTAAEFLMTIIEGLIVQAEFGSELPNHTYIDRLLEMVFS